jgi:hypothetical protein
VPRLRPALLLAGLVALATTSAPARDAAADPRFDAWAETVRTYENWVKRPSLWKRTLGRKRFAETKDPRARDILIASYAKPEDPTDHVRHLVVNLVTQNFTTADDLAPFAAWRAAYAKPEDAWMWNRTLALDRSLNGVAGPIAVARTAPNAVLAAAALAHVDSDDPAVLPLIAETLERAEKSQDVFEKAVLSEAAADALSKQTYLVGKPEFHDPAVRVIKLLEEPTTPWRTRIVVARRLATTFGREHPVLEPKYWRRMLLAAEGAEQAPQADDQYAQPAPPTFAGVPATGKRILYLIDCSDSMLAPISVSEVTELKKKPRGEITPGDDAGKPTEPPPEEPKPDEKPPEAPLEGAQVDWKKVKTRFDAARELLKASVRALAPDVSFAVVLFGSKAQFSKATPGMTPATSGAASKLAAELDSMRAGRPTADRKLGTILGDTNLHGAFRMAFKTKESGVTGPNEHVRPDAFLQGCDTIFLLSDGDPSQSDWFQKDRPDAGDQASDLETGNKHTNTPELIYPGPYSMWPYILEDVERMNLIRRVEIHAVGIGEVNAGWLGRLVALGGGRLRQIQSTAKDKDRPK